MKKGINMASKVKFPLGDITYKIQDVRTQGGTTWICIMSGRGYEWHHISSLILCN